MGGGIYSNGGTPIIYGNLVTGNTLSCPNYYALGTGVYTKCTSPAILNNTILANAGTGSGTVSGVYVESTTSTSTIANNVIASHIGIGIGLSGGSPSLVNNTIVSNGTGVSITVSGGLQVITNNIIAFNSTGIPKSSGTITADYNCVYNPNGTNYSGLSAGTNDVTGANADPCFVDLAGGDFHIQSDSPCIDLGNDAYVQSGWVDMDKGVRQQGDHVDIGADEVDRCRYGLVLSSGMAMVGTPVQVTVQVTDQ